MANDKQAVLLTLKGIMERRSVDNALSRRMKAISSAVSVACGIFDMDIMGTTRDMMMSLPVVAAYLAFGCDGDVHGEAQALLADPAFADAADMETFRPMVVSLCDRLSESEQSPDIVGFTVLFTRCQQLMYERGWDRMSPEGDQLYDALYDKLTRLAADGGAIDVDAWLK